MLRGRYIILLQVSYVSRMDRIAAEVIDLIERSHGNMLPHSASRGNPPNTRQPRLFPTLPKWLEGSEPAEEGIWKGTLNHQTKQTNAYKNAHPHWTILGPSSLDWDWAWPDCAFEYHLNTIEYDGTFFVPCERSQSCYQFFWSVN